LVRSFYRTQVDVLRSDALSSAWARQCFAQAALAMGRLLIARGRRPPEGWIDDEPWLLSIVASGQGPGGEPDDGSAGVREPRRPLPPSPKDQMAQADVDE
jgi:hypothetical protein